MNKYQKAVSRLILRDEKEKLWEGREKMRIGRSIPSSIRIYVKALKEGGLNIKQVHTQLDKWRQDY